jgi:hypothetical protein
VGCAAQRLVDNQRQALHSGPITVKVRMRENQARQLAPPIDVRPTLKPERQIPQAQMDRSLNHPRCS